MILEHAHHGSNVSFFVTLEHSPSEGSYVSAAEAVAWHILARADTFLRRSDLSFEVLTAMLFAACNAYNISPRRYPWGQ